MRRELLTQENLAQNAIAVSGDGYFSGRPGIGDRRLAIVRLDSIAGCKLVPRR
jgi:hypothetical protein